MARSPQCCPIGRCCTCCARCCWLFFRNFPDGCTLLGVAILIACAIYVSTSKAAQAAG
jgi:hypothetical protein